MANKKTTLYLDDETRDIIKKISLDVLRSGSISEAVRYIAKEYYEKHKINSATNKTS